MKRRLEFIGGAFLATIMLVGPSFGGAADAFTRAGYVIGIDHPDYYCTFRGARVDVEDISCLTIDGMSIEATCDISLNNPMWRTTGNSCDPGPTSEFHAPMPN